MNYKTTTSILAIVLIGTYVFFWNDMFYNISNKSTNTESVNSMHQMPDGTMMPNNHTTPQTPMTMESMMKDMMSGLAGKTGDGFDQAFLSEMIVHHQGAVEMAQAVIQTSKRPELLKLAQDIITAQNKEIEMMKSWETTWFKK